MIGWLCGKVVDKHPPGKLVLDVSGVGYDVEISLQTFFHLDPRPSTETVGLHIHTVVREDALLLYGFLDKNERSLFRALIKVNGVGPKVAMGILSSMPPADFIHCIQHHDVVRLTGLPGIGKKTAERLVIEMKDNLDSLFSAELTFSETAAPTARRQQQQEAMHALESLGYKPQDAQKMVRALDDGLKSCEQLIREALQRLAVRAV